MGLPAVRKMQMPEADSKDPARRFVVEIFEAWCKCCGICVAFCPRGCLEPSEGGYPLAARSDLCTGCGWCEIHCPDFAIRVRPRFSGRYREDEEEEV